VRPDSDEFMMSSIAEMARQYRESYRLEDIYPVEVYLPDWYARRLVERHGPLEAAADTAFRPGSVKLVNRTWRETRDEINTLFLAGSKPFHVSHPDTLFRIAVELGSGKI
jgi:hypothetical protein